MLVALWFWNLSFSKTAGLLYDIIEHAEAACRAITKASYARRQMSTLPPYLTGMLRGEPDVKRCGKWSEKNARVSSPPHSAVTESGVGR